MGKKYTEIILRRYKMWGGGLKGENALYVWAENIDDAFQIARTKNSKITTGQWTGEARKVKED